MPPPMPTQKSVMPCERAYSAAQQTLSQETPSVRITRILGTPLGQLPEAIEATLALMAPPVIVPLDLQVLEAIMDRMVARLLPQPMQGSQVVSQKWMDMRLRSSLVRLTQVVRNCRAYWKLEAPMLPDQSTRKLTDWYLLHLTVTASMRQALLRHQRHLELVQTCLSSEDMRAQLLYWKLLQKDPPRKSVFIQYLAVSRMAVLMFTLMSAQARAQEALPAVQAEVRLLASLFRKPVRTVVLSVAVRTRGKALPMQVRVAPCAERQGSILLVSALLLGTILSSSAYVRLSCTPLLMVTKLQMDSEQPQSQLYSSQRQKQVQQLAVDRILEPPFLTASNLSVTLVPQVQVREADSLQEVQYIVLADETKIESKMNTRQPKGENIILQLQANQYRRAQRKNIDTDEAGEE